MVFVLGSKGGGWGLGDGLICAVPRCGTHMDGLAWHVMIWYGLAKNGLFQFYKEKLWD